MISWYSIKEALDTSPKGNVPFGGVIHTNEIPYRNPNKGLASYSFSFINSPEGKNAWNGQFLKPGLLNRNNSDSEIIGINNVANNRWTRSFMNSLGAKEIPYGDNLKLIKQLSVPIKNIRPALYGNSPAQRQRESEDTRKAMANRWADLYSVANHEQANKLDRLRMKGYMPPVLDPNKKRIVWTDFHHPDEKINVTAFTSNNARAFESNPYSIDSTILGMKPGTISLPLSDDYERTHSVGRHELAHTATEGRYSNYIDKGIPAGDEGQDSYYNGGIGSYEADPAELHRMMLLDKAYAGSLGDEPFTNPYEWMQWYNQRVNRDKVRQYDPWVSDPSIPGVDKKGRFTQNDISSPSLVHTINVLSEERKDSNPYTRRRAKDRYINLMRAIQHAIDTADIGKRTEGVNV